MERLFHLCRCLICRKSNSWKSLLLNIVGFIQMTRMSWTRFSNPSKELTQELHRNLTIHNMMRDLNSHLDYIEIKELIDIYQKMYHLKGDIENLVYDERICQQLKENEIKPKL